MTNDKTKPAKAEIAPLVQGFDTIKSFQARDFFSRTGFEGVAHAAPWRASASGFPEIETRRSCGDVDRPRVVSDSVHELERAD